MTDEELREAEALLAAATPGRREVRSLERADGDGAWWVAVHCMENEAHARLVAAAPALVRRLLDEVRLLSRLLGDRLALDSPEVAELVERRVREERARCAATVREDRDRQRREIDVQGKAGNLLRADLAAAASAALTRALGRIEAGEVCGDQS